MTQYTVRKSHALGTDGICPFCHYIGPPLLCGCVTEMYHALMDGVPGEKTADVRAAVVARHKERVRVLNERYRQAMVPVCPRRPMFYDDGGGRI